MTLRATGADRDQFFMRQRFASAIGRGPGCGGKEISSSTRGQAVKGPTHAHGSPRASTGERPTQKKKKKRFRVLRNGAVRLYHISYNRCLPIASTVPRITIVIKLFTDVKLCEGKETRKRTGAWRSPFSAPPGSERTCSMFDLQTGKPWAVASLQRREAARARARAGARYGNPRARARQN
ncbi:hypothetical protein BC826DRAFT_1177639 [Russula brevipes]|nr:hypothetical protein BC826DRAFT_1177639 [Russula brevipes]